MMNGYLYLSAAGCVLALAATIALIVVKHPRRAGTEQVVVTETPYTLIMALFLVALAVAVLVMNTTGYPVGGDSANSYTFAATFSFMCVLMGCYTLLYTFMKRVVADNAGMVVVDLLGRPKTVAWNEVTKVKTATMTKAITFITADDHFTVNGEGKRYGKFVDLAYRHVPAAVGSDALGAMSGRLNAQVSPLIGKRR